MVLPILIPTLALTAVWGYAGSGLVGEGLQLQADADLASSAGKPAQTLVGRLQEERRLTAEWQESSTRASRSALEKARSDTNTAAADFRKSNPAIKSAGTVVQSKAKSLDSALDKLSQKRSTINGRDLTPTQTFRYYTDTTAAATDLLTATTHIDDGELARGAAATNSLVHFSEVVSREDALLAGSRTDPRTLVEDPATAAARNDFAQYLAAQRQSRTAVDGENLPEGAAAAYKKLTGTSQWDQLVQAEESAATRTPKLPQDADEWRESADVVGKKLRKLSSDSLNGVVTGGSDRSSALLLGAALGTVFALGVLAAGIVVAIRSSRSLTDRLARLHRATGEWADTTFPQLIEQLEVDEKTEPVQPLSLADDGPDELGGLALEIRRQWQTVMDATVHQARGREGAETVFLGLARRTQVLINRMIPKLDKLEREHEDSKLLKDIFAVDHLATRVRRHTENLLILGGALPGRRWSKAVPIYEVLRSAISETEEYSRVEALPAPAISLVGQAVADVGHLLAELIENGTSFSPPETRVCVSAEKVAKGLALEVVDRGLGMPPEQYEQLNRLLADPPKPDMMTLGEAPRLGLFVVARLANRHGLEVSLHKSPYGGTLAVVLLPTDLLEDAESLLSGLITEGRQEQNERDEREQPPAAITSAPPTPPTPPAAPAEVTGSPLDTSIGAPSEEPARLPVREPVRKPVREPVREPVGTTVGGNGGAGTYSAGPNTDAIPQPHLDIHGGYPAYAGAGLLPSTPGADSPEAMGKTTISPGTLSVPGPGMLDTSVLTLNPTGMSTSGSGTRAQGVQFHPGTPDTDEHPVESAPMSASRPHQPPQSHIGDVAYTSRPEPDVSQGRSTSQTKPQTTGGLPIRVRGENLAEPLRHSSPGAPERENPTASESSPDRAGATMAAIQSGNRRARASKATEPAGDPQAETPGHGADADDSVRKDQ